MNQGLVCGAMVHSSPTSRPSPPRFYLTAMEGVSPFFSTATLTLTLTLTPNLSSNPEYKASLHSSSIPNPQLQKEVRTSSIQSSGDKLTFSPSSGQNSPSPEEEDADFSFVDRLGVWPKRVL